MKGKLDRGILFASFSGEELGLLGSAEWVKDPTLPLDKCIAMLNMDMIGRIKDNKVYIGGVGTGSTFTATLEQAQKESHSDFKFEYSQGGYSASDHTSFVAKKIPVLFFFSGLAFRLSQAFRYLGQNQCAFGRPTARYDFRGGFAVGLSSVASHFHHRG